ncbi:MAG: riboflavin synthase [Candidatus Omnitrophica bacterium]|nr:riboflavin synthase [Candidatus Omnitrophota bacterium]
MFAGIIEELGSVRGIYRRGVSSILEIKAKKILEDTSIGDSISVDGVCLTVKEVKEDSLIFEIMPHTLNTTTLGSLRLNQKVNLERSLTFNDRISGHFVLGHVDCIGLIRRRIYRQGNLCFEIAIPNKFIRYCIPRSSIAVDGISLTIAEVKSNVFSIYIISQTLQNTILFFKFPSAKVNVEFDILIKAGIKVI